MRFPAIPMQTKVFPEFSVSIKQAAGHFGAAYGGELLYTEGKPFFQMPTDHGIAAMFLKAVTANPDEAWAFVSKNYVGALDLEALRDVLGQTEICRSLVEAPYGSDPKNCLTRSVLVVNAERKIQSVLHLHMIKEPDRYGQWKIYGVEQE